MQDYNRKTQDVSATYCISSQLSFALSILEHDFWGPRTQTRTSAPRLGDPTDLLIHLPNHKIMNWSSIRQTDFANTITLGSSNSSVTRNRQPSHAGRRRSTVLMNLQLNDPSLPSPGEMVNEPHYRTASPGSLTDSPIIPSGDPQHFRAPSLGEIHQEIEQEQEAQVVRYFCGYSRYILGIGIDCTRCGGPSGLQQVVF